MGSKGIFVQKSDVKSGDGMFVNNAVIAGSEKASLSVNTGPTSKGSSALRG